MYARVATWEGAQEAAVREAMEAIRNEDGPPEGVPSNGFTLLYDPDGGRVMAIGLFETREKLDAGHAVLEQMSPPGDGDAFGRRVSVEVWDVGMDARI
jgi:hypothetical protein